MLCHMKFLTEEKQQTADGSLQKEESTFRSMLMVLNS